MKFSHAVVLGSLFLLAPFASARAGVGDPQVRTDHPWYPGELACSTFKRLFETEAAAFERVTGIRPTTDEQKALASWLWRNTHYFHAEEGSQDLWGPGFARGNDMRNREYWTGLFANGFGLCGTTHSQWVAEMEALLGHGRGRGLGCDGHNAFEVFLRGGPYGSGKWVLLDHDLSTVVYKPDGSALMSLGEIAKDWKRLTDRQFAPRRQHGWLICGLHPGDAASFRRYEVAEYLAGYSGPPPMVHLRRGETLRRYPRPGLEDGKTFVFWGLNYNAGGIPGPERSITWVNQPGKMHGSKNGAGYKPGQARFGNAVYTYRPDFVSGDYREGVVAEGTDHVTFGFITPYIIAATPPNSKPWGIYDAGCKNGLAVRGNGHFPVAVSVDCGRTWIDAGNLREPLDLTDHVKGHNQYWLRLGAGAKALAKSSLVITTVCQANPSIMPRLNDGKSEVRFESSGRAIVSAGPTLPQAKAHLVAGGFGTPAVTLEVATPRNEPALELYAAAHVQSGSPPRSDVKFQIDDSTDGGKTWEPVVKNWTIPRMGEEPKDFWSQSMCWGSTRLPEHAGARVQVRFRNNGGKAYARCEAHLVYRSPRNDATRVTFDWTDNAGPHRVSHLFDSNNTWNLATGRNVHTSWVEFAPEAHR